MFTLNSKFQMKAFVVPIADINYYNEKHKIIRVVINGEGHDCKYMGSPIVPNPKTHVALLISCEEFMHKIKSVQGNRKNLLPGYANNEGDLVDVFMGFVFPIPRNQEVAGSNPSSGGAAFAISNTNMFDPEKVAIALTVPLDVDYTNRDKVTDFKDISDGIFINNNGTILIKSHSSSITMGEEGIYLGGAIHWEKSEHAREWLMGNMLHRFIPATIVTPMAMPEIPNLEKFTQIAQGAAKVADICTKVSLISDLINT